MSRKLPPLNSIKAFEAAARLRSFRAAAESLRVSHSAVSHQIKNLERFLDQDLFVRHARSVELTSAGHDYFLVVRDALDKIEQGTKKFLRPSQKDILTVQTYSTIAIRWLVPKLAEFTKLHPDLEVRLTTTQENPNFGSQRFDVAVMIGRPDEPGIASEYLFTPLMSPVCAPTLLSGEEPLTEPADLVNHDILQVHPSERDWRVWLKRYSVAEIDLSAGMNFDSYDHALKMAARGLGVALGMQPYVAEDLETGLLVQPFPECSERAPFSWYIAHQDSRRVSRKVSRFRDWLIDQIGDDPNLSEHRIPDLARTPV